ncbi:histidine kinase [Geomonas sp. Red276]
MPASPQLYSSRIINIFVTLIRRKYRHVDVEELLSYAGMTSGEVSDEGHWFTQRQVDLFHEKMNTMIGHDISREGGRFAASLDGLGLGAKCFLGMVSPAVVFNGIARSVPKLTRSSLYTSQRLAETTYEITAQPVKGVQERAYQCENRLGFLEAVPLVFNFGLPKVEHPECLFRGGDCCRYIVTWNKPSYVRIRTVRNRLTPVLLLAVAGSALFVSPQMVAALSSMLVMAFLGTSYTAELLEGKELTGALLELRESSEHLVEQVESNYNNARMVNEVGQAISRQSDIDEVLESVIMALENRLRYDRCLILLADEGPSELTFRTGFGYRGDQLELLRQTSFKLHPNSNGVLVRTFREQRPVLVNDLAEVGPHHAARSAAFTEMMAAQSFICCPIVYEGESLGVLAVDNVRTKRLLVQSDMTLLMGIAPVIGMSIRNAMYVERERRMEEQLRHSQKMEAVGQLAGGIAHDFNNLLTAIIGFANLSQGTVDADHPAAKYLDQVQLAADRASHLTEGLLAFSRKQVKDPRAVELNHVVENINKLLRRLITAEIELDIDLSRQRLQIMADPGQIEQVLMNLVANARDAISGSGRLSISTSVVELTPELVRKRGVGKAGSYAMLSVADTGAGMDAATKARIFEPFFTTKEVGKGTGLGMAIVYGIVQQHEGFIDVTSEPGVGTIFDVYLPILGKDVGRTVADVVDTGCYAGSETVLVAEDAPEVRRLTSEVLSSNGYRVIEAVDGEDAVNRFLEHRESVDLVIMDVVMPKMNGKDAYAAIARKNPRTKVLFTSGYTPDDVARKGVTFAKGNFLPKPSTPQELLKKVREVLAA